MANLGVEGMKALLRHVEGITPGTHCAPEQLRLPFHTSESGQGSMHDMILQDTVELCWSPSCPWPSTFISLVGKAQLLLQVLSNPFSQLCGQPAQDWVCSPVDVFQPFWRRCITVWNGQQGSWSLQQLYPAGFEQVDVQPNTTGRILGICLPNTDTAQHKRMT